MDLNKAVKKAIDIVKLDKNAISSVSKEKDAWQIGLVIIAIGAILGVIPSFFGFPGYNMMKNFGMMNNYAIAPIANVGSLIGAPIGAIIGMFVWTGILFLIAMIFGGKAKYIQLFQPLAYLSILTWLNILNIIPNIGGLISFAVGIWSIVVLINIEKVVYGFSTGRAVMVVLIPIVIIMVIAMIIAAIAAAALGGALVGSMFNL